MTVAGRIVLRRTTSFAFASLAIALFAAPSFARRSKRPGNAEVITGCVTSYKSGLDQERTGRLLEARELFIHCAKTACGSPLREECTTRFTQLSIDIPSVVPVVTNAAGKPELDIEVQLDGEKLASSLDGHSFILNPGAHDFSFSKDGHIFATQSLLIVQGQRNRLIAASLQPPPSDDNPRPKSPLTKAKRTEAEAAPVTDVPAAVQAKTATATPEGVDLTAREEPTPRRVIPTLSFVTAGVGVAALGFGALLTSWGRRDTDLLGPCSPSCPQSSADHIHNLYLAADISFGIGVAALAGSYWAYAHSRAAHQEGEAEVAVRSTPRIVLAPTPSGAVGTLSGTF